MALEGMEREQRVDFLAQELKRFAMEGHSVRESDSIISARGHVVGLGMDAGISMNSEPSLRDALGQPLHVPLHLGRD